MKWSEMQEAVADAKSEIKRTDRFVKEMVEIIVGRLRKCDVSGYYLRKLKRELQSFDSRSCSWRD